MPLGKPISIRLEPADEALLESLVTGKGSSKGTVAKQLLEEAIKSRANKTNASTPSVNANALADAVYQRLAQHFPPTPPQSAASADNVEQIVPLLGELVCFATDNAGVNAEVSRLRSDLAAFAQMFEEPPGDPPRDKRDQSPAPLKFDDED
jgi:hypothetical protein